MYQIKRIIRYIKHFPSFIKEAVSWECESCQECGKCFRVMWHVKDEIWNKVTNTYDGGGGSYCVDCFIKKAEKQGIHIRKEDISLEPFYPEKIMYKMDILLKG